VHNVFFLEHEVESESWAPLGLIEGETPAALVAACAELAAPLLPGRFRCLAHSGPGGWHYLELAADGAELKNLR